jgi:hypothetical protein
MSVPFDGVLAQADNSEITMAMARRRKPAVDFMARNDN